MLEKRGNKKKLLTEKIADFFDIPVAVFSWGMNFQIQNDRDLFVEGCTGISEYSENRVVFSGKDMEITAEGSDFELYTFADGRVKLSGKLINIHINRSI